MVPDRTRTAKAYPPCAMSAPSRFKALSIGCLTGLLFCLLARVSHAQTIQERVANRNFPSVFQAWNRADNLPGEDPAVTTARHDLMWHVAGGYGLRWNAAHDGLGVSFTASSLASGRSYRQNLLSRNPNMVLLMEIRYRDAPGDYLPVDSPWWMRDAAGNRKPGWAEGGYYLLNYPSAAFQAQVATQCKAAVDSGVVDGVLLDWWNDDNDRLNLVRTVRNAIGYGPLIIVNSNQRKVPNTARYVNGLFMEVYKTGTAQDWREAADTLSWAQEQLLEPRVNCLETWFHQSRQDLHLMRATTTLSLTHSNGYCLFSDPNPLPVPDHLHNWYPFWDKEIQPGRLKLGKPLGARTVWQDKLVTRAFEYGMAAYNAKGNGPLTLRFRRPVLSTATGQAALRHVLNDEDGDIYVSLWPGDADLNHDGGVDLVDFAWLARSWRARCNYRTGWCSGSDLDRSGTVDARDLSRFALVQVVGDQPEVRLVGVAALPSAHTAGSSAHYPMNEGAGRTVGDASGNGHDAIINGTSIRWQVSIGRDNNNLSFSRYGASPWLGWRRPPIGQWQHVAFAFDGTVVTMYLNGQPVGAGVPFSLGPCGDAPLVLGAIAQGGVQPFHGALDEVRLCDKTLSAPEILTRAGR